VHTSSLKSVKTNSKWQRYGAQTKEEQPPILVPFVTLQFAHPMTQKLLNLVKEYYKTFNNRYVFGDERFYTSWFVFLLNENGTLDLDCFGFQVHPNNSKFKLFHIFLFKWISFQWSVWVTLAIVVASMKKPEPTNAQWRMNGKWSGNSFLLGFSSLGNYGD